MPAGALPTGLTAELFFDWWSLPENDDRFFELVRGDVIELPFTTRIQGFLCASVGFALGCYCREIRRGYVTSNDCALILSRSPDTVRGPDLAYFGATIPYALLGTDADDKLPLLAVEVLPNDG